VSDKKYFAILIIALISCMWVNLVHHMQINEQWIHANQKFEDMTAQLAQLKVNCGKGGQREF
jgi:hypothetical protein